MGLIRAARHAVGGTLRDQWLDFFFLDAMPAHVLMEKGQRRADSRNRKATRNPNRGHDNIIANGSGIAVNEGQCMMIVAQGQIMEVCAEPGVYTYDTSTEPSIFAGELGKSIVATFKTMGRRFAHGGNTARDQRVYYFNIKELMGNKFGSPSPIPFRVVDRNIGLDIDITLSCNGMYSYKIADPLLFFTNVCGNVADRFTRDMLETQLRSEFITALKPAFSNMSDMGLRYSAIPGHTGELAALINEELSEKWQHLRGLEVVTIAFNTISAPKEDEDLIKELQRKAVMRDPSMAGAALVNAQAQAMKAAAANEGGAMAGFMGLGMMQQAGGHTNPQDFFNLSGNPPHSPPIGWTCSCGQVNPGRFCGHCGNPKPAPSGWTCRCGVANSGRFCQDCGRPQPEDTGWTCVCGVTNNGRFCQDCGTPKD